MTIERPKNGQPEIKFIQHYKLSKKIDQGAFGKIYRAISNHTGQQYAIKLQPMRAEHPQLVSQCKLYSNLHSDSMAADRGIPKVFSCGVQDDYNYLVMQLLGDSLQTLLAKNNKKFSLKSVLMLTDQMISLIQYFHQRNLLHRDVKPDNFCIGVNKNKHRLHLLDLGLAKTFLMRNGKHIPYRQGKSLTGTARYASVNTHKGIEQSRRDDMESICYVALYCLKGSLPWQGHKTNNKFDKYQKIKEIKINTPIEQLCKGCPQEFKYYLQAIKRLDFEEVPKYDELRQMFKKLLVKQGYKFDYQYDWSSTIDVNSALKKQIGYQ